MLRLGHLGVGPIMRAAGRQKSTFSLVVLQLATGFVIAASLIEVGSYFRQVSHRSCGYDLTELIGVHVREPRTSGDGGGRTAPTHDTLASLAALPGVAAAALVSPPLRAERGTPTVHTTEGRSARGWTVYASPSLIDVLGLKFVEGGLPRHARQGPGQGGDGMDALVLSQAICDKLFGTGESALGRVVVSDDAGPGRVVGVVDSFSLREPFWDTPSDVVLRLAPPIDADASSFLVRARPGQRATAMEEVRRVVGSEGPSRWVSVTAYAGQVARFQRVATGFVWMFVDIGATFALIALVGAVAVSSFVVAARRREIGIRRALGATRGDILRYFLVESTLAAALGTGIGLVMTLALLLVMRPAVGVPIGGWQLTVAALFLWANATAAALLPARRGARLPPTVATRGG
ncbi:MAG TPA: FtsX-like permease family protein [Polyangia bacterium]|nr:FtsX-like permease family protein [Polyangia bacterium]